MRPEWNNIEAIERYLAGQMSAEEKAAFETRLREDASLREALELRLKRDLDSKRDFDRTQHSDRIRHTQAIRRTPQHSSRNKSLLWGGAGLVIIMLAALIALLFFRQRSDNHNHTSDRQLPANAIPAPAHDTTAQPVPGLPTYRNDSLPPVNENGKGFWSTADSSLAPQTFWLTTVRDTVIETSGGILLSIPGSAFLDTAHRPITGTVELVIKEALDAASILKAGLSTQTGGQLLDTAGGQLLDTAAGQLLDTAGDQLLETGGMFYIDVRQNGKPVAIDPAHAIYAEIPADSVWPGMQLFTGHRLAGGLIDWTNPQPLEHDLVPIDIHSLNFYPPHYLDSVAAWGYDPTNRAFTDSLYFAFSSFYNQPPRDSTSVARFSKGATTASGARMCAINPARIAAIWTDRFQNTLIATREFEQRLHLIHQTGDNRLLDLYVDHLDLGLSAIDSIAATQTTAKFNRRFLAFADRHDGKLRNGDPRFNKLREYYRSKAKAFADAVAKTTAEFWTKEGGIDSVANNRTVQHDRDSVDRLRRNFAAELAVNLQSSCRQLGYNYNICQRVTGTATGTLAAYETNIIPRASYKVDINRAGWYNIDRYVAGATVGRQTTKVRGLTTGKRAVIAYNPVHFIFTNIREYDRVYLYLLPGKLNSFMRLTDSAGVFTENLNSEMAYRFLAIGYQGQQPFYYSETNIQPGTYTPIPLVPVTADDLDSRLQKLGNTSQGADLHNEQQYFQFEVHHRQRRNRDQLLRDLTQKMVNAFFACMAK